LDIKVLTVKVVKMTHYILELRDRD